MQSTHNKRKQIERNNKNEGEHAQRNAAAPGTKTSAKGMETHKQTTKMKQNHKKQTENKCNKRNQRRYSAKKVNPRKHENAQKELQNEKDAKAFQATGNHVEALARAVMENNAAATAPSRTAAATVVTATKAPTAADLLELYKVESTPSIRPSTASQPHTPLPE